MVLFHQGVLLLWQDSHTGCLSLHCAGTCEERMQFGHFTYSLMDDKLCSIQQYLEKCHTYFILNYKHDMLQWVTLIQNNPQHNIIEKICNLCCALIVLVVTWMKMLHFPICSVVVWGILMTEKTLTFWFLKVFM